MVVFGLALVRSDAVELGFVLGHIIGIDTFLGFIFVRLMSINMLGRQSRETLSAKERVPSTLLRLTCRRVVDHVMGNCGALVVPTTCLKLVATYPNETNLSRSGKKWRASMIALSQMLDVSRSLSTTYRDLSSFARAYRS